MGNCTSTLDALPVPKGVEGAIEGNVQELFTKALSSKDDGQEHLEKLIASKVDVNHKMEHETIGSCYPLHVACKMGNVKAAQLLLKAGADPNLCDVKGQTPLHWAIQESNMEIVDELLNSNADPNVASEDFTTPLQLAIKDNNQELVDRLVKGGAAVNVTEGEPPLIVAVRGNHVTTIMLLLKANASPVGLNFGFPEGGPTSMSSWATVNGHDEIAEWLMERFSTGENAAIEEMENEIKEASERDGEEADESESPAAVEIASESERIVTEGGCGENEDTTKETVDGDNPENDAGGDKADGEGGSDIKEEVGGDSGGGGDTGGGDSGGGDTGGGDSGGGGGGGDTQD